MVKPLRRNSSVEMRIPHRKVNMLFLIRTHLLKLMVKLEWVAIHGTNAQGVPLSRLSTI